jgi:hypothetical protein
VNAVFQCAVVAFFLLDEKERAYCMMRPKIHKINVVANYGHLKLETFPLLLITARVFLFILQINFAT